MPIMSFNSKFVFYTNDKGEIDHHSIQKAEEASVPEGRLKLWKFIWYLIFNKSFRWKMEYTLKYALRHHDFYRGTGASDVFLFEGTEEFHKIWGED